MPGTVTGNFEARGDTDWFRVRFEEGKTYTISTSNPYVLLSLALPDGTTVSPPVAYGNQITFVASVTGDYWVSATGYFEDPTIYSVTAVEETAPNPASTATNLTLEAGETATGTSDAPDDWYAVELVAGQSYFFSADLTARLYLSDANGKLLTLADHQLHFTPTVSGTYYAGIHFSGSYSLKMEEVQDDHGASAASAGTLSAGAAASGVWEAGRDSDWYAITLEAGSSYSFSLSRDAFAPPSKPLQIYDSSGQLVVQDGSGADQPTIIFSPGTSGTYYIAATGGSDYYSPHQDRSYSLTANLVPGELSSNTLTTGVLAVGTAATGTWEGSADSDWFAVSLTAGQAYSFNLSSTGQGVRLALYDASGKQLSEAPSGSSDSFGALGHTAVASGTYYIGVSSRHVGSATYSLTATTYTDDFVDNSLTAGTLTVDGVAVEGLIEARGDRDWFAVQLESGRSYVFSGGVALTMRDAQGNALTENNWGDRHFTPSASGTYYLEAWGDGGSYAVSISTVTDDYRQDILSSGVMRSQTVGDATNETFVSTSDHDSFIGQGGDDRFIAGDGHDGYIGGTGTDTVSFANFTAGVTVRLWQGGLFENGVLRIQIGSTENVEGSAFADGIEGNSAANVFSGGDGSDTLVGLGGNDTLAGNEGDDFLEGGAGDDAIDGGAGFDTASYSGAASGVTVNLSLTGAQNTIGAGTDTLSGIETLVGSQFGDRLTAGAGYNTIRGGGGNDTLMSSADGDQLYGEAGDDVYTVYSGSQVVEAAGQGSDHVESWNTSYTLSENVENLSLHFDPYAGASVAPHPATLNGTGNSLDNIITGSWGANQLNGLGGSDTLTGGDGIDTLTGGTGNDTFRDTAAGLNGDTITDFSAGDRIVISNTSLANFTFSLTGNTLNFTGGSLTLSSVSAGRIVAQAATGGGVQLTMVAQPPVNHGRSGDFNGDGRDDILWRSDGGHLSNWLANPNGSFAGNDANAMTQVGLDWRIAATGDFNGDGRDDILWRSNSGQLSDWLGQANGGFSPNDANAFTQVGTNWHVAGTGDFNGDGRDDILWRSEAGHLSDWLGLPNGGFSPNDGNALTQVGTDWNIVGTGDFNGDGRDDILWRSDGGALSNWLGTASGGFAPNDANAFTQVGTDWHVVGTGDFNGDGRDDILWRSDGGSLSNWLGTAGGGFAPNDGNAMTHVGTDWRVASVGDFNGDGLDDILWRSDGGALSNWLGRPNGGFTVNDANAYSQVAPSWQPQPMETHWV